MKHIDVIIWEQGDRVLPPCGPGEVRRGAANPTAEPSPVVVRLDGGRLDQFPGAELQPEAPVGFLQVPLTDGGTWTRLDRLTDGRIMCQLCFEYKTREELNPLPDGLVEDVCNPCAALEQR